MSAIGVEESNRLRGATVTEEVQKFMNTLRISHMEAKAVSYMIRKEEQVHTPRTIHEVSFANIVYVIQVTYHVHIR